jgi:hypothetical protein
MYFGNGCGVRCFSVHRTFNYPQIESTPCIPQRQGHGRVQCQPIKDLHMNELESEKNACDVGFICHVTGLIDVTGSLLKFACVRNCCRDVRSKKNPEGSYSEL